MLYGQKENAYLFSEQIDTRLAKDSITRNYQHYAINYAIIGAYQSALFADELSVLKYKELKKGNVTFNNNIRDYQPVDALNELKKISKDYQIVIINEAHYSAQNRIFTTKLLEELYENGYSAVFIEGLHATKNKKLNERKYPLLTSGYYFKEPQYGNLVRRAIKRGCIVLPYEHKEDSNQTDPLKRWYSREEGQANTILTYMKNNPNTKIVIHCGYGHLSEKIYEGAIIGNMAAIIKAKSGVNPLTINQSDWLETYSQKTVNPYRRFLDEQSLTAGSILKNKEGDYFSEQPEKQDINVYFPPTKYIFGRPDWLFKSTKKRVVTIPFYKVNLNFPYIVYAYLEGENEKIATPIDVIEIKNSQDKKALALEEGTYTLKIQSISGKIQHLNLTVN